jgi:hypothetical protein
MRYGRKNKARNQRDDARSIQSLYNVDDFQDHTDIRTTEGSEYEVKFISIMRLIEKEIFQLSVGEVPKG